MPLPTITAAEEERPYILVFEPEDLTCVRRQVDRLIQLGFTVDYERDGEVRLSPPALGEGIGIMRIISQNGDDRVTWDAHIPEEVKDAARKFSELIKKGYKACVTKSDGAKGHEIKEFDPTAGEIIMVPQTAPG